MGIQLFRALVYSLKKYLFYHQQKRKLEVLQPVIMEKYQEERI